MRTTTQQDSLTFITDTTKVEHIVEHCLPDDVTKAEKQQILEALQNMAITNFDLLKQANDAQLKKHLNERFRGIIKKFVELQNKIVQFTITNRDDIFWPKLHKEYANLKVVVTAAKEKKIGNGNNFVYNGVIGTSPKLLPCAAKQMPQKDFEVGNMRKLFSRYREYNLSDSYPNYMVTIYGLADQIHANTWVLMEKMDGDLHDLLFVPEKHQEARGKLMLEDRLDIMEQCCYAVFKLHELGFAHRDIKSRNFLFTKVGDEFVVKICDFGSLKTMEQVTFIFVGAIGGTLEYIAPERLQNGATLDLIQHQHADVYSLGVVLCELFWHVKPFSHLPMHNRSTGKKEYPYLQEALPTTMDSLKKLILQCAKYTSVERPSAAAILDCVRQARVQINIQQELQTRINAAQKSNTTQLDENVARWLVEHTGSLKKLHGSLANMTEFKEKAKKMSNSI